MYGTAMLWDSTPGSPNRIPWGLEVRVVLEGQVVLEVQEDPHPVSIPSILATVRDLLRPWDLLLKTIPLTT
jgi:hypothetical protein